MGLDFLCFFQLRDFLLCGCKVGKQEYHGRLTSVKAKDTSVTLAPAGNKKTDETIGLE
jgi:hypothetical protein